MIYSTWLSASLPLEPFKFIATTKSGTFDLGRDSDIVTKEIRKGAKRLQPSRHEPEDAPSFTRRLQDGAGPLPDPLSRRLEYPPVQE